MPPSALSLMLLPCTELRSPEKSSTPMLLPAMTLPSPARAPPILLPDAKLRTTTPAVSGTRVPLPSNVTPSTAGPM